MVEKIVIKLILSILLVAGVMLLSAREANSADVSITISGTLYSDEGTTPLSGQTVQLLVYGDSKGTDVTDSSGNYSITATVIGPYMPLLVYVDGGSVVGTTVTVLYSSISTTINDLHIYAGHLITRQDEGFTPLDNGDIRNAKGGYSDTDVLYYVSGLLPVNDLTVTGTNTELYVASGHDYAPDGNITTPHVKIMGTLTADNNTFTVSGDWEHTNGIFNYDTSTVDFTGSGTISNDVSNWWNKPFYNVNAAASGQTTTILATRGIVFRNILILGMGTVAGGEALLSSEEATPLVTAGATLSNSLFKYEIINSPVNITSASYPNLWLASKNTGLAFTMLGDISCNTLNIFSNNAGNQSILDTADYTITCNQLNIGESWSNTRYGKLQTNNGTVTINGDVNIHSATSGTNEIDAGSGSINVSGDWTNNDTFTANVSTVTMNGNTNQNITSSGSSFNNLILNNTGSNTITLNDALGINGDLTITSGALDTTSANNYSIAVSGNYDQSSTTSQVKANASTITVGGNFSADGTIDSTSYNSAYLVMSGTGFLTYNNLSSLWENGFFDLTVGQSGNTTTLSNQIAVLNQLRVDSGALEGTTARIYLRGIPNPLVVDIDANINIDQLRFFGNSAQNLPPLLNGYDSTIRLSRNGTILNQTGAVTINAGSNLILDGDTFANRAVTYNTNNYDLAVGGNIQVGAGNDTALKRLDITNSTVTVGGDFDVRGIGSGSVQADIISTGSTVILNGSASQTVTMNNSDFNNLTVTNVSTSGVNFTDSFTTNNLTNTTASSTMIFAAGETYTIDGAATLQGASGQLLTLASSSPGTPWNFVLNSGATKAIDYVNVSWSDASGSYSTHKPILPTNSNNSGNNIDWFGSNISVNKTSTLISDPVNGTGAGRNHIPGAIVEYTITTTNSGDSSSDADSIILTIPVDSASVEYDVTTGISFTAYNSGLSLGTVTYAHKDTPTLYNYSPISTYDPNVASIKITTNGAFNHTDTPDPRFTVTYRVRIQ